MHEDGPTLPRSSSASDSDPPPADAPPQIEESTDGAGGTDGCEDITPAVRKARQLLTMGIITDGEFKQLVDDVGACGHAPVDAIGPEPRR